MFGISDPQRATKARRAVIAAEIDDLEREIQDLDREEISQSHDLRQAFATHGDSPLVREIAQQVIRTRERRRRAKIALASFERVHTTLSEPTINASTWSSSQQRATRDPWARGTSTTQHDVLGKPQSGETLEDNEDEVDEAVRQMLQEVGKEFKDWKLTHGGLTEVGGTDVDQNEDILAQKLAALKRQ